jgi:hypothetical protein
MPLPTGLKSVYNANIIEVAKLLIHETEQNMGYSVHVVVAT